MPVQPQSTNPLDRKITPTGVLLLIAIVLTFAIAVLPLFDVTLPGSAYYLPVIAWSLWGLTLLLRLWLRF